MMYTSFGPLSFLFVIYFNSISLSLLVAFRMSFKKNQVKKIKLEKTKTKTKRGKVSAAILLFQYKVEGHWPGLWLKASANSGVTYVMLCGCYRSLQKSTRPAVATG